MEFPFLCDVDRGAAFAEVFSKHLPEIRFSLDADEIDDDDVQFIMTWDPPANLRRNPNLQAVFCIGAGVDHSAGMSTPPWVRLIRMVDESIPEWWSNRS